MRTRELMEKRANLVSQARSMLDVAEQEKRLLTEAEQAQYDLLIDEAQELRGQIDRETRQLELEAELAKPEGSGERGKPAKGNEDARGKAFSRFLAGGTRSLAPDEARALAAGSDVSGGFLLAPQAWVSNLIQAVDNAVYIRQWATRYTVTASESLGAPSLETDVADPTWTSEVLIGTEDTTMAFGKRELTPHPLAKYIKVSRKLLRMVPDVDGLVQSRLAYKFGTVMEYNYMLGDGAGRPLGVFVASDNGIPAARDYSTGNTATEIRFDGLIGAKYTLKPQYRGRARWLFHRDGMSQISKLKDGSGAYLWQPSVQAGQPDRILNIPVFESEYVPNTFTTKLYVGILGDFSFYWIADALSMEIQRLEELYAATNQVGFIGRMESDGMPVLGEAFVRVKLA